MTEPIAEGELLWLMHQVIDAHGRRIAKTLHRRHRDDKLALARALAAAAGVGVAQTVRAHRDVDLITILECAYGCSATKTISALTPEGIKPFSAGKWFATMTADVAGLAQLANALEGMQRNPRWLVIRGELIEGHRPGAVRKKCSPDPADPAALPTSGPSPGGTSRSTSTASRCPPAPPRSTSARWASPAESCCRASSGTPLVGRS
jgi:hypothetical protein